ncbi:MAG: DTW domain-containing protein [Planctomycetota bacterium]
MAKNLGPGHSDNYTRAARCTFCKLTPRLCVCDELPRIELPFRFVIVRHGKEVGRQSNTGALVPRLLPASVLVDYGLRDNPYDPAPLVDPRTDYWLLFPDEQAHLLTRTDVSREAGRSTAFVVLDATWRQARRMLTRLPELRRMRCVALPAAPQPAQLMRKAPAPGRYFTLEAVTRTVETLGFVEEAAQLRAASTLLVRRVLHIRGKLPRRHA